MAGYLENFNESPISNGNAMIMDEPVNSSTNAPGGFAPGDIAEGLSIRTVAQPGSSSLLLYGAYFGSLGNDSVLMGIFSPAHDLKVSFYDNQTYAAGMNLMLDQADDALAVIYGPYGKLLGTKSIALLKTKTFFGDQANQPLSGIAVMNADRIELFDDIQFGGAPQNLTFSSDPTAFNKTASRFQMEDFSESPVLPAPALPLKCDEPFSNTTNNSCFAPGDIQAGISFSTLHGTYCPECLYVYGEDSLCSGNPKSILAPTDNLNIGFSHPVNRVGLNVYGADFFVYVYDQNDHILGAGFVHSLSCPGVFLGISFRLKISRILLGDLGTAIFLQDIRFGYYFPWPMFQPAFSSD